MKIRKIKKTLGIQGTLFPLKGMWKATHRNIWDEFILQYRIVRSKK